MKTSWLWDVVKAIVIVACFVLFAFVWPIATAVLLSSLRGHSIPAADGSLAMTYLLMFFVGASMGIHVGMLLIGRTVWLPNANSRRAFTQISTLFAILITTTNFLIGGMNKAAVASFLPEWSEFLNHYSTFCCGTYFLCVQALPLLWFLYNLHGDTLEKIYRRRRSR